MDGALGVPNYTVGTRYKQRGLKGHYFGPLF